MCDSDVRSTWEERRARCALCARAFRCCKVKSIVNANRKPEPLTRKRCGLPPVTGDAATQMSSCELSGNTRKHGQFWVSGKSAGPAVNPDLLEYMSSIRACGME